MSFKPRRRVFLMRHGSVTYFDNEGKPYLPETVPLNEQGQAQTTAARKAKRNGDGKQSGTKELPDTSPERFRSESGRSRKAEVAAGQRMSCAGQGLTAKSQRRAGDRKQSGKLATLRGRQRAGRQRAERMALEAKDFQIHVKPFHRYIFGGIKSPKVPTRSYPASRVQNCRCLLQGASV